MTAQRRPVDPDLKELEDQGFVTGCAILAVALAVVVGLVVGFVVL